MSEAKLTLKVLTSNPPDNYDNERRIRSRDKRVSTAGSRDRKSSRQEERRKRRSRSLSSTRDKKRRRHEDDDDGDDDDDGSSDGNGVIIAEYVEQLCQYVDKCCL